MTDLNTVNIIGRIANEPDLSKTSNGISQILLTIANNREYSQNNEKVNEVNYFKIRLYGSMAENLSSYLKKGKQIAISGRLHQYSYDNSQTGFKISVTEIIAHQIQFLGKKKIITD